MNCICHQRDGVPAHFFLTKWMYWTIFVRIETRRIVFFSSQNRWRDGYSSFVFFLFTLKNGFNIFLDASSHICVRFSDLGTHAHIHACTCVLHAHMLHVHINTRGIYWWRIAVRSDLPQTTSIHIHRLKHTKTGCFYDFTNRKLKVDGWTNFRGRI